MQKIRKILRAVSEKTALPTNQQPTNQPTSYYQQHRSYTTSLTPNQLLPTTPILKDVADASPKIEIYYSMCFFASLDNKWWINRH